MSEFFTFGKVNEAYFKAKGEKIQYKKGFPLVWDKEKVPWVFFLTDGLVRVSLQSTSGPEILIGYFLPGMTFAQSGSSFDIVTKGITYETSTPSTIYRIPIDEFFKDIESNHELTQELLVSAFRNQILLVERIGYQGEKGIKAKFIKWLLFMAKYYGNTNGKEVEIYIPLTQETIGQFVNATRESINKTMSDLAKSGLIQTHKKKITILDLDKLTSEISH